MANYTNRQIEMVTIKSVNGGVTFVGGMGTAGTPEVRARLKPGMVVGLETQNFSNIVGWLIDDEWVGRKSDEDQEAERQERLAKWEQEKRDRLAANREDWTRREAALPDWIRVRLTDFREHEETPGSFDLEGWGYELIIAELAVLYDTLVPGDKISSLDVVDPTEIQEYAEREGSSGNQHQMAIALVNARRHDPNFSMAGTVSALSPITGKAGY